MDKITSVEETAPTQQTIRVYPHPVSNDFHLVSDDLASTNDIAIINSQGKIVATHRGSSNGAIALNADALGLVSGNYTAVINGTRAVRFVVIK
ncbi:MAG: T9SS type A sorting domain-containing protein [Candidatus Kapaibacterium sp.]